jgi:hypothetical protein
MLSDRNPLKFTVDLMRKNALYYGLWIACLAIVCGCGRGDSSGRIDVSGKATFDGQPIVYGQIDFTPDNAKGHKGPAGYAEIVNGKFDTSLATGSGVVPGAHIVRITAYPERFPDVQVPDEEAEASGPAPLFIGYTTEQNIESGTLDIDVPAEAKGRGVSGSP